MTTANQDGQCVADKDGDIIYVDDDFAELAGAHKKDLIGKKLDDVVPLSGQAKSNQSQRYRQNAFVLPGFYNVHIQPSNKSASVRIDEMNSQLHQQYIIVTITNQAKQKLDEQKKFEEGFHGLITAIDKAELNENELNDPLPQNKNQIIEYFKYFFDLSVDILLVLDENHQFVHTNRAFKQLLNLDKTRLEEINLKDIVHPKDQEAFLNFIERDKKDAYPSPVMPVRIRVADGDYQWLEGSARRVGNRYYCVLYDISARRKNEAELKLQEEQLADAQELAHMGHWQWRVDDDYLTGSDEMYRIFGVDRNKFSSRVDDFHDLIHPDDLSHVQSSFRQAVIDGQNSEFEFRILQPDGSLRYVHCEGRCEVDENGNTLALFGFIQDVTEQKESEDELRLAKESAEAAYRTKSRFLANMSHELRTPLNAIIGFAEMMEEELLGPLNKDNYHDYILGIRQSGELLLDLITDILDMSKMEMGKYDIQRDEMDLAKAVRLATHMVETRANEAGLNIKTDIPSKLGMVYADRRAIMQILLNLLSNAVKFTDPGGVITTQVKQSDDYITLIVQDTGVGIPAEKLDVITRPFEQVSHEMTRRHKGTGLGLAITQSLVDLHDGKMIIESKEGSGTTVQVELPVTPNDRD